MAILQTKLKECNDTQKLQQLQSELKKCNDLNNELNNKLSTCRTEKEQLITELKEMLNETSRKGQLERKQQEAQFHRDTLQQVPLPIYIF